MALIIVITNQSNLAPVSDYHYQVLVGDGGPLSMVLAEGKIVGHVRDDGWQTLVQMLLDLNNEAKVNQKRYTCLHQYWDLGYCIDCGIHSNDPFYTRQLRERTKT